MNFCKKNVYMTCLCLSKKSIFFYINILVYILYLRYTIAVMLLTCLEFKNFKFCISKEAKIKKNLKFNRLDLCVPSRTVYFQLIIIHGKPVLNLWTLQEVMLLNNLLLPHYQKPLSTAFDTMKWRLFMSLWTE